MIRQRKDRDGLQVQVYAGRDPLTGRKRYASRQIPGSGRAAMKQAKQIEAQLLAEVGAGRHQRSAMTLAQLLDEWLSWRESNGKLISPATLHGYRLTLETKIKPALDYLPVAKVDARVLDRFYAALRKAGNVRTGGGKLSASRIRDVHAILVGYLTAGATPVWLLGSFAVLSLLHRTPAPPARPPTSRTSARRRGAEQAGVCPPGVRRPGRRRPARHRRPPGRGRRHRRQLRPRPAGRVPDRPHPYSWPGQRAAARRRGGER